MVASLLASLVLLGGSSRASIDAAKRPPMGWTTWCTDGTCGPRPEVCTDAEVRSVASAMKANGMLAAGWDRINLDDCWSSQDRDARGWLVPVPDRFPHGMKPLIDFLHGLGFKMGLYISGGRKTCRGQIGSYGFSMQDVGAFDAWGADYVKEGVRPANSYVAEWA
jgi:alpha-galactosidase